MTAVLRLVLLLSVLVLAAGCGEAATATWLESARSADDRASREAFLDEGVPPGMQPDDARVVRHDVAYQLARELLDGGDAEGAVEIATEALNEGRADDVFTANLFVVRGQALEALGEPVRATLDYHEALMINETLLEAALAAEGDEE